MQTARSSLLSVVGMVLIAGCGESAKPRGPGIQRDVSATRARFAADGFAAAAKIAEVAGEVEHVDRNTNTETYDSIDDNPFLAASINPLSTFSIDVDTASYANVRRYLNQRQLPPPGAVRIEELVNYFSYEYPQPAGEHPFSVNVEVAGCPWQAQHRLARIGLKGAEISQEKRPLSNLVFLLDVSGSMQDVNKLPLVKSAMKLLVERLSEHDRVAIVVYAGNSGVVLPSISVANKQIILSAIDQLHAEGSTNGGSGIRLAYQLASDHFIPGGVNRVILCTDGDFNVGVTNQSELVRLIEDKAKSGVFLSVLGFGVGNYKDSTMEKLADRGNGNYAYIDSMDEAKKVLVEGLTGTLITIAKDVKIQIDFNPASVAAYRLLGYENRLLRSEDFKDDQKDAGEIGAGHTVTALYEIVPAGQPIPAAGVDRSKYQQPQQLTSATTTGDLFTVRLRYKQPDGQTSQPLEVPVSEEARLFEQATSDFQFAACVAQFGMLLRNSKHRGDANYDRVLSVAAANVGPDLQGHRSEFLSLVRMARDLKQPMAQARR